MFTSLEFTNFRGFQSLKLEGLQRVNLVVGRNNAGKTSFLEGLAILANPERLSDQLPGMFRPFSSGGNVTRDYFPWLVRNGASIAEVVLKSKINEKSYTISFCERNANGGFLTPPGKTNLWNQGSLMALASQEQGIPKFPIRVVSVLPRPQEEIVKVFAKAVRRRDGEEKLDQLFHIIDERILKVRVIPFDNNYHQIMFDFGLSEMVPMSQVGQGLHRLLTIFSEILSGEAIICIIDEIENGIHHSMLEQVWTGIAAAAETLGIQVFATTHSQECIEAANEAFSKRPAYDFSIVQLFRLEDGVQGRVLDKKHIEAAMAGEIDLR
ncbi:MAG: AAA family ATPase [Verrucomicrobia bacterium]|nr:AAA family ATPase [Verrucomicrobiota bacterium]